MIEIRGKILNPDWMTNKDGLSREAVEFAEALGEELVDLQQDGRKGRNEMTTSQVRNFFGEVRRIQMKGFDKNKSSFNMLKPKLAYAVARAKEERNKIHSFQKVANALIDKVNTQHDFDNFVNFLEATVAYHKANGGRD